jgi:hypothetical protein
MSLRPWDLQERALAATPAEIGPPLLIITPDEGCEGRRGSNRRTGGGGHGGGKQRLESVCERLPD